MATGAEIDRALAAISVTLNDQGPERFNPGRIQELVTGSLGGERKLTVDGGGGVHDEEGRRLAAVRRSDDGRWIVERQNPAAHNASAEVPAAGESD